MKIIDRRLRKLEHRFGTGEGEAAASTGGLPCRISTRHSLANRNPRRMRLSEDSTWRRRRRISGKKARRSKVSTEPNPRGLRTSMVEHKIATDITRNAAVRACRRCHTQCREAHFPDLPLVDLMADCLWKGCYRQLSRSIRFGGAAETPRSGTALRSAPGKPRQALRN